jgi:hypothetical protein
MAAFRDDQHAPLSVEDTLGGSDVGREPETKGRKNGGTKDLAHHERPHLTLRRMGRAGAAQADTDPLFSARDLSIILAGRIGLTERMEF